MGLCPNCGKPLRQGSRFCGYCRAEIPVIPSEAPAPEPTPVEAEPQRLCPNCGGSLRESSLFCPVCGCDLRAGPALVPVHSPVPQEPEPVETAPVPNSDESLAPIPLDPGGLKTIPPQPPVKKNGLDYLLYGLIGLVAICLVGFVLILTFVINNSPAANTATPTRIAATVTMQITHTTEALIQPSKTNVSSPTLTAQPSATVSPTIEQPILTATPEVILSQDFTTDQGWEKWGSGSFRVGGTPGIKLGSDPATGGVCWQGLIGLNGTLEINGSLEIRDGQTVQIDLYPAEYLLKSDPPVGIFRIRVASMVTELLSHQGECQLKAAIGTNLQSFQLFILPDSGINLILNSDSVCSLAGKVTALKSQQSRFCLAGTGTFTHLEVIQP